MKPINRRSFVGAVAAGFAVLATSPAPAEAERIYHTSDWKMEDFNQLCKQKYEVKQIFDATAVDDGSIFGHINNSLNGLQFGFGIPEKEIKIVAANRGPATVMNFNDFIWDKYKIGERAKVEDPKTKQPALRNIFYPSDFGNPAKYTATDPNDEKSFAMDSSIQALQARGVQLLACHMAITAGAGGIKEHLKLTQSVETIVQEIQANLLPGVIVVPSMVSAIPMLQSRGHFTYLRN